jgi:hypothetical protein
VISALLNQATVPGVDENFFEDLQPRSGQFLCNWVLLHAHRLGLFVPKSSPWAVTVGQHLEWLCI